MAGSTLSGASAARAASSTSAAPTRTCAGSSPAIAAGSSPTSDSAAYRPPIAGSWSRTRMAKRAARRRSALSPGSVMAVNRDDISASPSAPRTASAQTRNWVRVSAVVPDFEITKNPVRASSSPASRASKLCGSTLSMNRIRGAPGRGPKPVSASAQRVRPPRLEPPVPSTTTSSNRSRNSAATGAKEARSSRAAGNRSSGRDASARRTRNRSSALLVRSSRSSK